MNKIPKIRFSEFNEEWKEKKLRNIFSIFNGFSFLSEDSVTNGARWVKISDVGISKMNEKNPSFLPKEYKEKYKKFILREGDYVIALTRPILDGKLKIARINKIFNESLLNQRVGKICSNENINFVYAMLQRRGLIDKIEKNIAGSDPPNLSPEEIKNIKIYIPGLAEQEKIATFISSIDNKIEKLERKKELWEQYNKGMMQKIFSQNIKFKDENENEYPEWEEKNLGKIGQTFNGLTGKTKEDFGQGKPYITYKSIFDSSKINLNRVEFVYIDEKENQDRVQYGDIFFTTSSETPNEVGMASVLLDDIKECYLNSFCFGFRLMNISEILPNFMRFYLRSEKIRDEISKLSQGSTRYNLSKIELMKLNLNIPNPLEQIKIADLLSSIDSKIEMVDKELIGMKEFKKGLLQQMFV